MAAKVIGLGGKYVDAPVTGGPSGAQNGGLTIMAGGEEATVASAMPLFEAMGKKTYHFGPVGAGHTAKLIQNMISIITGAGIAEGFALAAAAKLDVEQLFEMLSGASSSPSLQYIIPRVLARDFDNAAFRLDLVHKDIRQATELARELTVPLQVANSAVELIQLTRAFGFGNQDGAALIRGLEKVIGIEIAKNASK